MDRETHDTSSGTTQLTPQRRSTEGDADSSVRGPAAVPILKGLHPPRAVRNLALIGFMGTGKTTIGRLLAAELRFDFIDTDALIESRMSCSINDLFKHHGEAWFREYERRLVLELSQFNHAVFATGGGLGANLANLNSLKEHAMVVCLCAKPETIWRRVRQHSNRPLLQHPNPQARLRQLLEERKPIYRQADVLVNTDLRPERVIVAIILYHFRLITRPAGHHEAGHPKPGPGTGL